MMHTLTPTQALEKLASSREGLTDEGIQKKIQTYGLNELPEKKRSLILLFLSQFQDTMVYILIGALLLSTIMPFFEGHEVTLGSFVDAFTILAILVLNAVLGFIQEYQAEEAINHLKNLTSPHARVRRNGVEQIIESKELVPGDIVIVEAGDSIAADGRLLKTSFLELNESSLTGESRPSEKHTKTLKPDAPLGDRDNMVFSGTLVTTGSGEYVVTSTGLQTEIGKIASLVAETKLPETPLARRMKSLGRVLGLVVIVLCAIIFVVGILKSIPFTDMLLIAVSLAVSAVPEGLPAVITVCLALGVRQIAKQNVLVRRMESLETLGSVTVICSDKTGTITENRMTVIGFWTPGKKSDEKLLTQIMASCNHAELPNLGDPTEIGLLEYAKKKKIERLEIDEEEVPFTSEKKYMQTRHSKKSFIKGAPEVVVTMCDDIKNPDAILAENAAMAERGLRVLAGAVKEGSSIRFVGLMSMEDPPRKTVLKAMKIAKKAGIRTIMITGDNLITARTIGHQVGIEGEAMEGKDIDGLTEKQLQKTVTTVSIYARVSPEHKLAILNALKANGEIVAMSGDGVNDAPALKGAHVGVAMGKNGTEVAREAASVVLADDHYSSIVTAVKEGRRIYDNIKKFIIFLLRTNFDELLFIVTAMIVGMPLPYLPVHILLINLMSDSLPALALATEKAEADIMERKPRPKDEHILSGEWDRLFLAGFIGFGTSFALYWWLLQSNVELTRARTIAVTFAIIFEFFTAFSMRSNKPFWKVSPFGNRLLVGAVAIPFTLQLILLYSPMNVLFEFVPLNLQEWGLIVAICMGVYVVFEIMKLYTERDKNRG